MSDTATLALTDRAGKYLTFQLGDEEYGIEILKVQEIIGIMNITRVPRTPPYVRGVINLRGKVIPVVDLRLAFGMPSKEYTGRTCIIVVQVTKASSEIVMGVIVDDVSEVANVNGEQIEPPPSFGAAVDNEFIHGMAKVNEKVLILLNIDRALSDDDLASVGAAMQN